MAFERRRGAFLVSDDPGRLDRAAVHAELARSYWSPGVPLDVVERAIANSLCFGLYREDGGQVGFARAITDRATYAYLADVYVAEELRGEGLGTWMMSCVMEHPDLQGLRRMALVTRDAHALYRRFGFETLATTDRHMEIVRRDVDQKR